MLTARLLITSLLLTPAISAQCVGESPRPGCLTGLVVASYLKQGATVRAGQFGLTVAQFKDHYCAGSGLAWACNPGKWHPRRVSDTKPAWKPRDFGAIVWDSSGAVRWIYDGHEWADRDVDEKRTK